MWQFYGEIPGCDLSEQFHPKFAVQNFDIDFNWLYAPKFEYKTPKKNFFHFILYISLKCLLRIFNFDFCNSSTSELIT